MNDTLCKIAAGVVLALGICRPPEASAQNSPLPVDQFVLRAKEQFKDLQPSEEFFLKALLASDVADLSQFGRADAVIRANVIAWAMDEPGVATATRRLGIRAASIKGPLLLFDIELGRIVISDCILDSPLSLMNTTSRSVSFRNLTLHSLRFGEVTISGDLAIENCRSMGDISCVFSKVTGGMGIIDTTIGSGGVPLSSPPIVLNLKGTTVDHSVLMSNAKLHGTAALNFTTIGGSLELDRLEIDCDTEIASKIENSRIMKNLRMSGCLLKGMLSLDMSNIDGRLEIEDSTIGRQNAASLSMSKTNVAESVDVEGSELFGTVVLRDSEITGSCRLSSVTIKDTARFRSSVLAEELQIGGSLTIGMRFNEAEPTQLRSSLEGPISLDRARVKGDLKLTATDIVLVHEPRTSLVALTADGTEIGSSVIFGPDITFGGEVTIQNARIGKSLTFHRATISDASETGVTVESSDVGGNLALVESSLGRSTNVVSCNISKVFLWQDMKISGHAEIKLLTTTCRGFALVSSTWFGPERADIRDFKYSTVLGDLADDSKGSDTRATYLRSLRRSKMHAQQYVQLAEVLKANGFEDAATETAIESERLKVSRKPWYDLSWVFGKLYGVTVGYGFHPFRAVWFALAVIAFGWYAFKTAEKRGLLPTVGQGPVPVFWPSIYSIDMFFPLVSLSQGEYRLPKSGVGKTILSFRSMKLTSGDLVSLYYWVHIGLGWLISSLFVAGVASLVRST